MTKHRFKRIFVDGVEISVKKLEEYNELEWLAYEMGMVLDPEALKIIPIKEQTKQWPEGDNDARSPEQAGW